MFRDNDIIAGTLSNLQNVNSWRRRFSTPFVFVSNSPRAKFSNELIPRPGPSNRRHCARIDDNDIRHAQRRHIINLGVKMRVSPPPPEVSSSSTHERINTRSITIADRYSAATRIQASNNYAERSKRITGSQFR